MAVELDLRMELRVIAVRSKEEDEEVVAIPTVAGSTLLVGSSSSSSSSCSSSLLLLMVGGTELLRNGIGSIHFKRCESGWEKREERKIRRAA